MPEIYFAQIREDSLVERHIMTKFRPRKVLCIGSGGCTAFSILNDDLHELLCVDLNQAQCALVELKKAAITTLERNEFLAFIGERPGSDRLQTFSRLESHLPSYAKDYWASNRGLVKDGINKSGATERFYSFISSKLRDSVYGRDIMQELFGCANLEDQQKVYQKHFTSEHWLQAIRYVLSKDMHLRFFPSYMFAHARVDDFSNFFLERFEVEVKSKLLGNNYFLSQFLFGEYLEHRDEGLPYYLSEAGYKTARNNLHKLRILPSDISSVCRNSPGTDCFFLSNVFDWADQQQRKEICRDILSAASGSASLLYRSMFAAANISSCLPEAKRDDEYSGFLAKTERSMMYKDISFLSL
jgi:S-adenosylmethionine-diacylglycerol 3-amino-3-carboxypropyl transferase